MAKIISAIGPRLIGLGAPLLAKAAIAVLAGWLATIAVLGIQTWRLGNAQADKGECGVLLDICTTANHRCSDSIAEQAKLNQERIEAALKAQEKAEQLAQLAGEQREVIENELQNQIERLRLATAGNACAVDRAGNDVAGLLIEAGY